jgi:putative oxidoreductase
VNLRPRSPDLQVHYPRSSPARAVKTTATAEKTRIVPHAVLLDRWTAALLLLQERLGRFDLLSDCRGFWQGETTMKATRYLPFAGRLLIGLAFTTSGISKLAAYGATINLILSSKLPLPPPLAYTGAVMVELGCGVLMIAGYQVRVVAGILALFCVATAVFFHTNFADPDQIFHFIKNVVMTGGLLQIVAFGAGAFSIDNAIPKGQG